MSDYSSYSDYDESLGDESVRGGTPTPPRGGSDTAEDYDEGFDEPAEPAAPAAEVPEPDDDYGEEFDEHVEHVESPAGADRPGTGTAAAEPAEEEGDDYGDEFDEHVDSTPEKAATPDKAEEDDDYGDEFDEPAPAPAEAAPAHAEEAPKAPQEGAKAAAADEGEGEGDDYGDEFDEPAPADPTSAAPVPASPAAAAEGSPGKASSDDYGDEFEEPAAAQEPVPAPAAEASAEPAAGEAADGATAEEDEYGDEFGDDDRPPEPAQEPAQEAAKEAAPVAPAEPTPATQPPATLAQRATHLLHLIVDSDNAPLVDTAARDLSPLPMEMFSKVRLVFAPDTVAPLRARLQAEHDAAAAGGAEGLPFATALVAATAHLAAFEDSASASDDDHLYAFTAAVVALAVATSPDMSQLEASASAAQGEATPGAVLAAGIAAWRTQALVAVRHRLPTADLVQRERTAARERRVASGALEPSPEDGEGPDDMEAPSSRCVGTARLLVASVVRQALSPRLGHLLLAPDLPAPPLQDREPSLPSVAASPSAVHTDTYTVAAAVRCLGDAVSMTARTQVDYDELHGAAIGAVVAAGEERDGSVRDSVDLTAVPFAPLLAPAAARIATAAVEGLAAAATAAVALRFAAELLLASAQGSAKLFEPLSHDVCSPTAQLDLAADLETARGTASRLTPYAALVGLWATAARASDTGADPIGAFVRLTPVAEAAVSLLAPVLAGPEMDTTAQLVVGHEEGGGLLALVVAAVGALGPALRKLSQDGQSAATWVALVELLRRAASPPGSVSARQREHWAASAQGQLVAALVASPGVEDIARGAHPEEGEAPPAHIAALLDDLAAHYAAAAALSAPAPDAPPSEEKAAEESPELKADGADEGAAVELPEARPDVQTLTIGDDAAEGLPESEQKAPVEDAEEKSADEAAEAAPLAAEPSVERKSDEGVDADAAPPPESAPEAVDAVAPGPESAPVPAETDAAPIAAPDAVAATDSPAEAKEEDDVPGAAVEEQRPEVGAPDAAVAATSPPEAAAVEDPAAQPAVDAQTIEPEVATDGPPLAAVASPEGEQEPGAEDGAPTPVRSPVEADTPVKESPVAVEAVASPAPGHDDTMPAALLMLGADAAEGRSDETAGTGVTVVLHGVVTSPDQESVRGLHSDLTQSSPVTPETPQHPEGSGDAIAGGSGDDDAAGAPPQGDTTVVASVDSGRAGMATALPSEAADVPPTDDPATLEAPPAEEREEGEGAPDGADDAQDAHEEESAASEGHAEEHPPRRQRPATSCAVTRAQAVADSALEAARDALKSSHGDLARADDVGEQKAAAQSAATLQDLEQDKEPVDVEGGPAPEGAAQDTTVDPDVAAVETRRRSLGRPPSGGRRRSSAAQGTQGTPLAATSVGGSELLSASGHLEEAAAAAARALGATADAETVVQGRVRPGSAGSRGFLTGSRPGSAASERLGGSTVRTPRGVLLVEPEGAEDESPGTPSKGGSKEGSGGSSKAGSRAGSRPGSASLQRPSSVKTSAAKAPTLVTWAASQSTAKLQQLLLDLYEELGTYDAGSGKAATRNKQFFVDLLLRSKARSASLDRPHKHMVAKEIQQAHAQKATTIDVLRAIQVRERHIEEMKALAQRGQRFIQAASLEALVTQSLDSIRAASVEVLESIGAWRQAMANEPLDPKTRPVAVAGSATAVAKRHSMQTGTAAVAAQAAAERGFPYHGVDYFTKMQQDLGFIMGTPLSQYIAIDVLNNPTLQPRRRKVSGALDVLQMKERNFLARMSCPQGTLPIPRTAGALGLDGTSMQLEAERHRMKNMWFAQATARVANVRFGGEQRKQPGLPTRLKPVEVDRQHARMYLRKPGDRFYAVGAGVLQPPRRGASKERRGPDLAGSGQHSRPHSSAGYRGPLMDSPGRSRVGSASVVRQLSPRSQRRRLVAMNDAVIPGGGFVGLGPLDPEFSSPGGAQGRTIFDAQGNVGPARPRVARKMQQKVDPKTGRPVLDPKTGRPVMEEVLVPLAPGQPLERGMELVPEEGEDEESTGSGGLVGGLGRLAASTERGPMSYGAATLDAISMRCSLVTSQGRFMWSLTYYICITFFAIRRLGRRVRRRFAVRKISRWYVQWRPMHRWRHVLDDAPGCIAVTRPATRGLVVRNVLQEAWWVAHRRATQIARAYRHHLCRRFFRKVVHGYAMILRLQRWWRHLRDVRRWKRRATEAWACIHIVRFLRWRIVVAAEREVRRRWRSAILIQRAQRCATARALLKRHRRERDGALAIQRWIRGTFGRTYATDVRNAATVKRYIYARIAQPLVVAGARRVLAAWRIQMWIRRRLAHIHRAARQEERRRELRTYLHADRCTVEREAQVMVAKNLRRHMARRRFEEILRPQRQAEIAAFLDEERNPAAASIQRAWHIFVLRMRARALARLRRSGQCFLALWRCNATFSRRFREGATDKARARFLLGLAASRAKRAVADARAGRGGALLQERQEAAAFTIQAMWHRAASRAALLEAYPEYHALREAQRRAEREDDAARCLQVAIERHSLRCRGRRTRAVCYRENAMRLQRFARNIAEQKRTIERHYEAHRRRVVAVVKIQTAWRIFKDYQDQLLAEAEEAEEEEEGGSEEGAAATL